MGMSVYPYVKKFCRIVDDCAVRAVLASYPVNYVSFVDRDVILVLEPGQTTPGDGFQAPISREDLVNRS